MRPSVPRRALPRPLALVKQASRRRLLWVLALALVAVAGAFILLLPAPGQDAVGPPPLEYVGVRNCEECHAEETRRWRGSQHDLAMQEPAPETVLGDFADARFTYGGVTSRFYRKDGRYFVRTDGPDGKMADFAVEKVFGVFPLQQYLVALPGGRLQALGVAWDSRPKGEGGQRWFHLYPGESVDHRDVLHWTKPSQNWNTQCAECHSTNLRKGYAWPADRFVTTWSEIDVSCEACHGPGSRHVAWAKANRERARKDGDPGLIVRFTERRSRTWEMDSARGIAKPTKFLDTRFEVETCARCHSRRGLLDGGVHGRAPARPDPPAGPPRRGPLLRRRADEGRGLQLRLLPPEPDVRGRRDLLRLPRRARPEGQGRPRRRLLVVPPARALRRARAPLPQGEGQGRLVRRPATCGPRHTWWSTRATTTRCASRAPTSR